MITILAPYGRNEVTAAAIRLADLAAAMGREVRLVACGLRESGVHPLWDGRVRSGDSKDGIYRAATKATHVVHFQCHQTWYQKASLTSVLHGSDAKHVLVPLWHSMSPADKPLVAKFDRVVCPTRACKRRLLAAVFDGDKDLGRDRLAWVRWDPGVSAVRREGTVGDNRVRACFYCDSAAIDFCGGMVIRLVDELLMSHPKLDATVLSVKSWSRHDRHDLKRVESLWGKGRLAVRRVGGACDLTKEFHAHDWVVVPGVRSDFGFAAAKALSCGAAVIAHNVEPFNEVVSLASGLLVPCGARFGPMKAPIAVPVLGDWVETCGKAFSDNRHLLSLQTRNWELDEVRETFDGTWSKILA